MKEMQSLNINKDAVNKLDDGNEQDRSGDNRDQNRVLESTAVEDNLDSNDKHIEQGDKMNKDWVLDSKAQEEMNETTKEVIAEEELEPIFDGTEVPGMHANEVHQLVPWIRIQRKRALCGLRKQWHLRIFSRRSTVAVTSVLRRLSFKTDEVEQAPVNVDKDTSDSAKLEERTAVSPKTAERSAWNPLN
ncbi:hypothetical protein CRYUN_Cryun28dG0049500 [Craigia yunnanensis]